MAKNVGEDNNSIITQLIGTYWLSVKKLSFTYVKDWSLAEDITQEVFIRCYKNIGTFRGDSNYKTWIFSITVNRCKDILRSHWFKHLFIKDELKDLIFEKEKSAEHAFFKENEKERLTRLVLTLPMKYREVIILFYYEELKLDEIQSLLGTNLNTIKTRLKRGKALLRKGLEGSDW